MFYMSDLKEQTVNKHIENKIIEVMQDASKELRSIFSGVETSDMKMWGSQVCIACGYSI